MLVTRHRAFYAFALGLCLSVVSSGLPAKERVRDPNVADPRLREPGQVSQRLNNICRGAGYGERNRQLCARAMSEHCQRLRIDPRSARCWQWFVDRDAAGRLDPKIVRAGGKRVPRR